jgi:hypothetical protein
MGKVNSTLDATVFMVEGRLYQIFESANAMSIWTLFQIQIFLKVLTVHTRIVPLNTIFRYWYDIHADVDDFFVKPRDRYVF